ncbi:hypothetical protein KP509_25G027500 [Ceratopteris richardii]|uniref:Stress-response A/B barrel domain-containing protein n=1 Tax=Ceratopteris richardii TaxID=49495 RepID=A0A8T2RQQ8_CERRI|nr:hypothetical protein KP509_25G027500 [Ceratopteris richardii]
MTQVNHVVMVKFKEELSTEQKDSLIQGFHDLPSLIPDIKAFEWGPNVTVEDLHQGFTHVFVLTFHSPEGRDNYLVHPAHTDFANKLLPAVDKVVVFDFHPSPVKCQ